VKIFCIGFNRTGTISLHRALEVLGFRSLHWGGPETRRQIERAMAEDRPLVDDFPEYDAFSDIWVLSDNFDVLDRQYPESRFILTTRGLESWLDSRRHHVEKNIVHKKQGRYSGTFLTVDINAWTSQYHAHHSRVQKHFERRPDDLLVMNIPAGDGYDVLCPFLGLPARDEQFPWNHRGATSASPTVTATKPELQPRTVSSGGSRRTFLRSSATRITRALSPADETARSPRAAGSH
jgi:hypothetical protein